MEMTENPLPVRNKSRTRPALHKGRRARKFGFLETLGCPGVSAIILMFFVCFSHIILAWYYSAGFKNFSRLEILFNLVCAGGFLAYGMFILFSWKKITTKAFKRHLNIEKVGEKKHLRNLNGKKNTKKITINCHPVRRARKLVSIRGPHYLNKVVVLEIMASGNCIYNLLTLYICILPPVAVVMYCLFEVIEGSFRLYTITIARATVQTRYRRLQVAIISDVLLSVVPIIIIVLNFSKLSIGDMFQMTFLPSIMLLSKTRSFIRETINQRTAQTARDDNRDSITRCKTVLQIDEMVVVQARNVPRAVVWGMRAVTALFVLLMVTVVTMVLIATSSATRTCEKAEHGLFIWNRCNVKVPLCRSWFNPQCNCADLQIVGHNFTMFPEIINSMSGLRRAIVTHGPLERISNDFGIVTPDLSVLTLDHNRLSTLPKGLEQVHSLHTLYASFNRLRYIPSKLWSLPNLYAIDLSSNHLDFENIAVNAPNLHYLLLQNNSATKIPVSLTYDNCPNLVSLDMAGNRLTQISKEVGTFHRTLVELVLSRNNLTDASFPSELQSLFLSSRLDVRNNSIASLPRWFEHIIGQELYIANNPICSNDWKLSSACPPSLKSALENPGFGCSRQCSPFCNDIDLDLELLGATERCIPGCNSEECGRSNGWCSYPTSG